MVKASLFVLGFGMVLPVAGAQSNYHSPPFFLEARNDSRGVTQDLGVSDGGWRTLGNSDWQTVAADDPNVERPSIVKLEFRVSSDDGVAITATALFGEFDQYEPSMRNMRSEAVATHSFKVNELVSFPELARFGIRLQDYRLVPAQPEKPYRPRLESKAPSLTFDYTQTDRTMGKITIHNHSEKAVAAFMVGNAGRAGGMKSQPGRPLIAPGGTYEYDFDPPMRFWCIQRVCGPEPLPLILQEVVFDDGSHEGDLTGAMEEDADWLGRSAAWREVVNAAGATMSNPHLGELDKIHSLVSVIDEISVKPDGDTSARFRMQFPDLPAREMERGEELLAMGMRAERDYLKWCLESREEDLRRNTNIFPPITEWWERLAGR